MPLYSSLMPKSHVQAQVVGVNSGIYCNMLTMSLIKELNPLK